MSIIKWLGTTGIILSAVLRVLDFHMLDIAVGFVGTSLWVYASLVAKDYPLLTVNLFVDIVLLYGLVILVL